MAVEAVPEAGEALPEAPQVSSSGSDLDALPKSEELAELMGTPPTRAQSRSRLALLGAARPPGRPRVCRVLAAARRRAASVLWRTGSCAPCAGPRWAGGAPGLRSRCMRTALRLRRPEGGAQSAAPLGALAMVARVPCKVGVRAAGAGRLRGDKRLLPSGYFGPALACSKAAWAHEPAQALARQQH